MKAFSTKLLKSLGLASWLPLALLLTGCGSTQYAADPVNPQTPFTFPGQTPASGAAQVQPLPSVFQSPLTSAPVAVNPNQMINSAVLRAGDLVRISFTDIPQPPIPLEINIPEDGKITLPYSVTVIATGKTVSQLQEEIRNAYVPKLFVRLTINIKTEQRFYFVGGEVRAPARQPYGGAMTVLRAIDSVGGFTDFADRTKIELRRSTGETFRINGKKAIKDSKLDLPVYPNDQITVHRRFF